MDGRGSRRWQNDRVGKLRTAWRSVRTEGTQGFEHLLKAFLLLLLVEPELLRNLMRS